MSDEINIRVTMNAYDKLKLIKKWHDVYFNTNTTKKYVLEYALDQCIHEKRILNKDIPEVPEIINSAGYRFDSNTRKLVTRDALNVIKKKKKLKNMTQVIDIISKYYIDNEPEMNEIREELFDIVVDGIRS